MEKIIFRADGNSKIGLGHFYRALALAAMLKNHFYCVFAIATPEEFIKQQVLDLGLGIIELPAIQYSLPDNKGSEDEVKFDLYEYLSGNEIVVLDGYWFGENYQAEVKKKCRFLFYIDDQLKPNYNADAIINHAPGVNTNNYIVSKNTRLYLGLDYLLLRPEFYSKKSGSALNKSVFISLGGSDAYSLTLPLIKLVNEYLPEGEINILVTSAFKAVDIDSIYELSGKYLNIKVHENLSAGKLVNIIDRSSHCVVASSTVLLECFARGRKAFSGYYVSNQMNIFEGMLNSGFIYGAGNFLEMDSQMKVKLAAYLYNNYHIFDNLPIYGVDERYIKIFKEAYRNN